MEYSRLLPWNITNQVDQVIRNICWIMIAKNVKKPKKIPWIPFRSEKQTQTSRTRWRWQNGATTKWTSCLVLIFSGPSKFKIPLTNASPTESLIQSWGLSHWKSAISTELCWLRTEKYHIFALNLNFWVVEFFMASYDWWPSNCLMSETSYSKIPVRCMPVTLVLDFRSWFFFDLEKHLKLLSGLTEKLEKKMALKEVSTESDYKSAISSSNLVAVHFQAPWAPECETVSAVLQVFCPTVNRSVYFSQDTNICPCTLHFCVYFSRY